ncbi:MAG: transglutaminase-like domain-containing protein, partial [Lachnospiraceae bacterium]|nr:transglutaminase-like domain-containing protein [Lachnospiraceae bacterium]
MGWVDEYAKNHPEDSDFARVESDYRKFVHKNYISTGSENKKELEKKIDADNTNLATLTKEIRVYLNDIGKNRKDWSSANYASKGALLFRAKGVPTRYVEGYLISGKGNIVVTAADAHAWVEVYKDGVGWLAVDVTPGYYQTIPEQGLVKKVKNENVISQRNKENKKEHKKEQSGNDEPFKFLKVILIILIIILLLIILFLVFMHIRWLIIMKRRKKEMEETDKLKLLTYLSSYL